MRRSSVHVTRGDPLPLEAVRDLVGIVRALYAARQREFASKVQLAELAEIGKQLSRALRLAESDPRTAWSLAEDACARLGRVVGRTLPAAVMLEAACVRVRKRRVPLESEREDKRAARKIRS